MDSDYRARRQAAAKTQLRNNIIPQLDYRNNLDDFDNEGDCQPDYPCPYCYQEFDIASSLCSHLDADHSYESKSTGGGRLRRAPFSNSQPLSLQGREALLGGTGFRSNTAASSPDNILSSLAFNLPTSECDDISKSLMSCLEENSGKNVSPQHMWKSSFHSNLSREEREKRMRQAAGRAFFVRDLLASTLLADK